MAEMDTDNILGMMDALYQADPKKKKFGTDNPFLAGKQLDTIGATQAPPPLTATGIPSISGSLANIGQGLKNLIPGRAPVAQQPIGYESMSKGFEPIPQSPEGLTPPPQKQGVFGTNLSPERWASLWGSIAAGFAPHSPGGRIGANLADWAQQGIDNRLKEAQIQERLTNMALTNEYRRMLIAERMAKSGIGLKTPEQVATSTREGDISQMMGYLSGGLPESELSGMTSEGTTLRDYLRGSTVSMLGEIPAGTNRTSLENLYKDWESRNQPKVGSTANLFKRYTPESIAEYQKTGDASVLDALPTNETEKKVTETEWLARAAKGDPEAKKVVKEIERHKRSTQKPERARFVTGVDKDGNMVIVNEDTGETKPIKDVKKTSPKKPGIRDLITGGKEWEKYNK